MSTKPLDHSKKMLAQLYDVSDAEACWLSRLRDFIRPRAWALLRAIPALNPTSRCETGLSLDPLQPSVSLLLLYSYNGFHYSPVPWLLLCGLSSHVSISTLHTYRSVKSIWQCKKLLDFRIPVLIRMLGGRPHVNKCHTCRKRKVKVWQWHFIKAQLFSMLMLEIRTTVWTGETVLYPLSRIQFTVWWLSEKVRLRMSTPRSGTFSRVTTRVGTRKVGTVVEPGTWVGTAAQILAIRSATR